MLLAQEPKSPLDSAKAALANGAYAQAFKDFKQANKAQNDRCAECYLGMAMARLQMSDMKGTTENAAKALQRSSTAVERAMAHYYSGEAYRTLGDAKQLPSAEKEYGAAVQEIPNFAAARLGLALTLIDEHRESDGVNELKTYAAGFPAGDARRKFAERMIANPARARENYAPEFQLTSRDGKVYSLDSLAGKTVVLDFWATWCPPCRESVPDLKKLHEKYADSVVVLSISNDTDSAQWESFITQHQMDWPQYFDRDHQITDLFRVHAFPTYIVIDPDGIIRRRIVGENPQQTIVSQLKATLAKMIVR